MHSTLGVSGTGTRLDLIEWLLLEHWNVSSSWALHGDGHRHNRTAWEVESILGVFWSSPFIFSFLTCLLDIREALCTSAYRFFFFLYFLLLSPLDWLASLRGETKDAAFHHCYHCGSISASCFLRLTYPGACMSQVLHFPFIVLISLFYRARVAGSIVVSTIAMETISIESCLL